MQLENQALLEAYNQAQGREDYQTQLNLSGLQGLAGVGLNTGQIANLKEQCSHKGR